MKYQLLDSLNTEERSALEADIVARGVMVPVEVDEAGAILDGHHRAAIAKRYKLPYKTIVREGLSEAEKREHVIKLNLCRRHLEPHQWGRLFKRLLEVKGVKRQRGGDRSKEQSATVALCAEQLGVPERTAKHRLALADAYEKLPEPQKQAVDEKEVTVAEARREVNREQNHAEAQKKSDGHASKTLQEFIDKGMKFGTIYADPPWRYGNQGTRCIEPADDGALF